MNQEMQEIEAMLHSVYLKNLDFLDENYPALFQKVEKLSKEIESGEYEEQYALEMMNGYFDIKNLKDGGYYYASNSYEDAEQRATYNDFTLNSSWDLLRKTPDGKHLLKSLEYTDVLPIVEYINENVDLLDIEYREIFKMVFIGTGLGLHINEIYKQINPKAVLIIEPELEIFRLSLFTLDYTQFVGTNKVLFFAIDDDPVERLKVYRSFEKYQEYVNFNVKHYKLLKSHDDIKDEITDFFAKGGAFNFPYKLVLDNLRNTLSLLRAKEKFLDLSLSKKKKVLTGKKVLLISAGPSLQGYLKWIEEHQDKFIIVCVDIVVRKLEENNIVPDIVTAIDPLPICAEYVTTKDPNFLNNSAYLLFTQHDEEFLQSIPNTKMNFYCMQSLPIIDKIGFIESGGNVGTFAFIASFFLEAKEFYLIGNDSAFEQETGSFYSDNEWNRKSQSLEVTKNDKNISSHDIIEVKGNLREVVKTTRLLITFRDQYERFFDGISTEDCEIYNLSDGAYIRGMEPLEKEELEKKIVNAKSISKDITKDLDKVFKIIEDVNFDEDVKVMNSILRKISKYKKNTYKNRDDFLQNKLDLMIWIIEKIKKCQNHSVFLLFMQFTVLADLYVNFILNLKQRSLQSDKEINKIAQMWIIGVHNLFKDIKKAIK